MNMNITNTRKRKRSRRRRNISDACVIGLIVLGCVVVPAGLLGLAVFIVRFAWTLGGAP